MATFLKAFAGRRLLVTGHTGFKGSWLSEWLLGLGSDVWGFSLAPTTKPALFTQLGLKSRLNHIVGDLRNPTAIASAVARARPDFVFHLAAQPIVRTAHADPIETWRTNVMGTVHLLEALRTLTHPCSVVVVTTDKVYGHRSLAHSEQDPLDALEPYGASKAAVELAVASWRDAFFSVKSAARAKFPRVALATARAGNVIGGGDWAKDRLVPDCIRALSKKTPILVRNPSAVRPWQHVLDPLAGYLCLAAELDDALRRRRRERLQELSGAFNLGPAPADHCTVRDLVDAVIENWPGKWRNAKDPLGPVENPTLRLDARKARRVLGWRPKWRFDRAVSETVGWYKGATSARKSLELTQRQIAEYESARP